MNKKESNNFMNKLTEYIRMIVREELSELMVIRHMSPVDRTRNRQLKSNLSKMLVTKDADEPESFGFAQMDWRNE